MCSCAGALAALLLRSCPAIAQAAAGARGAVGRLPRRCALPSSGYKDNLLWVPAQGLGLGYPNQIVSIP